MARGWESKSVESQQEEASRSKQRVPHLSLAERATADRRRTLELQRARTSADLARATAPAHRQMLERAITAIDEQIAALV